MKQTLSIMIVLLTLAISAGHFEGRINIDDQISKKSYYYFNDIKGTPAIDYSIVFENRINVDNISIMPVHGNSIDIAFAGNNPDISMDNDRHYMDTPNTHCSDIHIGYMGNNTIISFVLFPVIDADSLTFASNFSISMDYETASVISPSSPFDMKFEPTDNQQVYTDYVKFNEITSSLDMIIITSAAYESCFDNFILLNNLMGIRTDIKTIEDIYAEYSGTDRQEQIRNFIIEQYSSKGIRMITIGGDDCIVPIRKAYNDNYMFYGYVPTDAYYADMDGDWNGDNDAIIGETSSDDIDGYPELAVSRIPFGNMNELNVYMNKVYSYIFSNNESSMDNFLLAGSSLTEGLSDGSGQVYSDYMKTMPYTYSYDFTTAYSPVEDTFRLTPAWQMSDIQLNTTSFINEINNGYYFINHIDHSHETWLGMGMYETDTEFFSTDTSYLNNNSNTYSIMFSMGCTSSPIDRESVAEALVNAANSPIVSYTGFSRTGWTSSRTWMNTFWNTMGDNSTKFFYESYISAMDNYYLYFRLSINNLGIPSLPIFHKSIKPMYAQITDSVDCGESITININNGTYNLEDATIVLMDSDHYYRKNTDLAGNASFDYVFTDSIILVGITRSSSMPIIDTIFVRNNSPLTVDTSYIDDMGNNIIYMLTNISQYNIDNISCSADAYDSLIHIASSSDIAILNSGETAALSLPISILNRPINNCNSNVLFSYTINDISYNDSIPVLVRASDYDILHFAAHSDNGVIIDSILISNNMPDYHSNVNISVTSDFGTINNGNNVYDFAPFDTILLTSISCSNILSIDSLNFIIEITDNNRIYTQVLEYNYEKNIDISYSYDVNGIMINYDYPDVSTVIYKSNEDDMHFIETARLSNNICSFTDNVIKYSKQYYYAVFYDIAGRTVSTSDTIIVDCNFMPEIFNTVVSGSYYGKLNDIRYYAKSSMNIADMNNDGNDEIIVVGDDGKISILDNNMENILAHSISTGILHETTPALGDIDNNGYLDIIIGCGADADTTAMIVFNPLSAECYCEYITGKGILNTSPVISDIDFDNNQEILLGTKTGFYVFNSNLEEITSLRKVYRNITAIAVSPDDNLIVFTDYYGKIYAMDVYGTMQTNFPYNTGEVILAPFIMGDIDNNSVVDIVVGTAMGSLYIVDQNGNLRPNFPYTGINPIYQSPRITDYNNDLLFEISVFDLSGVLTLIDVNGNKLADYSISETGNNTYNEPLIADINSDGSDEIILSTRSGNIHIVDFQCNLIENVFHINDEITSTPILLNNDNGISLLVKTLTGNIHKLTYISNAFKSDPSITLQKTMIDRGNTSFVDVHLLSSLKDLKTITKTKDFVSFFHLNKNITNSDIIINYALNNDAGTDVYVVNKLGSIVSSIHLDSKNNSRTVDFNTLGCASGEYFLAHNVMGTNRTEKVLFIK